MNDIANLSANLATRPVLEGLAAVRIGGPDRVGFLQGQLTQDVAQLRPGEPRLTGWTNAKGRLLFVGRVFAWGESLWLVLPAELAPGIVQRLRLFVLRADVSIELSESPVRAVDLNEIAPEKGSSGDCFHNDKVFRFRPTAAHPFGFELGGDGDGTLPAESWRAADVMAGVPNVLSATAEAFVPQMVNLDALDAISFTKGCYVGQEIVARTQNLGRIKRRMYAFESPGPDVPDPGAPLYRDGRTAGQIVDATALDSVVHVLAVVPIAQAGTGLSTDAEGRVSLQPTELPYALPAAED